MIDNGQLIRELGFDYSHYLGRVGVEIEMEGDLGDYRGHDHNENGRVINGWQSLYDGSLRGDALEFIFEVPLRVELAKQRVVALYDRLAAMGCTIRPSDRCSAHVHLNQQDVTCDVTFRRCMLYLALEPLLNRWCGPSRESNLFCLQSGDAQGLSRSLSAVWHSQSWYAGLQDTQMRYSGLNIQSLSKFGSLEYRAMLTPAEPGRLLAWIDTLIRIEDKAAEFKNPMDIVTSLSARGTGEFLTDILGEMHPLHSIGSAELRENLLRRGIRQVQQILMSKPVEKSRNHVQYGFFPSDQPEKKVKVTIYGDQPQPPVEKDDLQELLEVLGVERFDELPEYFHGLVAARGEDDA
jgi:hypothetical protein